MHSHGDRISVLSWNARWMVDPLSERTRGKKLEIENALAAGRPVLLQETHWTESTEAVWTSG
eukprot:5433832-Lingulodinium_polyedra.AAC.1